MKNRKPALAGRVAKVEIEVGQPGAGHQPLVNEGAAGARGHVHADALRRGDLLRVASKPVKAPFPFIRFEARVLDEAMPDRGHRVAGAAAERVRVDRDLSPVRHSHAQRLSRPLEDLTATAVPLEQRRDCDVPAEQTVRYLDQEPGAIAALAVGVEATAMGEASERAHAECDRLVSRVGGRDEAHPASRATCGELPCPGKACRFQRWGH